MPHSLTLLIFRAFVIAAFLACAGPAVQGQTPGALDLSFDTGSAVNNSVRIVVPAGNGKVYIGGSFSTVRGAVRQFIARLNADGTEDETFNPGTSANNIVYSIAVQTDGKVLIGGDFTSYDGTPRQRIARLNSDGSVDASFDTATGPNSTVNSIALQIDGKVLIGGLFTSYSGTARNRVARLNSDGSLDMSFDPGVGVSFPPPNPPNPPSLPSVHTVAVQADGKVLIGGEFPLYNATARRSIARLNSDGSLDVEFNPGTGADGWVNSVAVQADGKVLIGGYFTVYDGTPRNRIARLNSNGSLDASFNPGTGVGNGVVNSIVLQAGGKMLIGGSFSIYNGTVRRYIARLNSNGSLDTNFGLGDNASGLTFYSIAVQADGKVLIGGEFYSYTGTFTNNGAVRRYIARLDSNGSLDTSFNTGSGASDLILPVAAQADGKVLIGGYFTSYNDIGRNRIARLNSNGILDTSFDPGTGTDFVVNSIAVQFDGKLLIGGQFTTYNGTARKRIARLNSDGSLDMSFNPGTGIEYPPNFYDGEVNCLAVQADGKVLIGGYFTRYNGATRNYLARANSDGSLDTTFNPGSGPGGGSQYPFGRVDCIAVQADGKVLIGGGFTNYNGTARNRIARISSDGNLDTSFDPGSGANQPVDSIAVQADRKVLISGTFTNYNGTARNYIARLNSDGTVDTSFNPGVNGEGVGSFAVQADAKVLIGGSFTSCNGAVRNRIARLNSDGGLDMSFDPGSGANSTVSITVQADGKVLIDGPIIYNGTARGFLARVANDAATQNLLVSNANQVQWLRGGAAPEVEQVTFDHSADGVSWTPLGAGTRISGGWERTGLNLGGSGYIRARGRATAGYNNANSSVIEQVYAFSDADSDGLLDSWELTYWPTTNGHKASDDFDGDGVPELLELAFGLNPTVADAALQPLVIVEGGYLTITIAKHAGVTYEVQTAGTLLTGQPDSFSAGSTTVLINDATTLKVRDNFQIGSASDRYLRVKVTAAP